MFYDELPTMDLSGKTEEQLFSEMRREDCSREYEDGAARRDVGPLRTIGGEADDTRSGRHNTSLTD
jgi:hypothetical protein